MYLWQPVDSEGETLEVLVQPKRDTTAAVKRMGKQLKKQGSALTQLITDKLRSRGAAHPELGPRLTINRAHGLITARKAHTM